MKLLISASILLLALNSFASGEATNIFHRDWTMTVGVKVKNFQESFEKFSEMDLDVAGISYDEKIIDLLIDGDQYKALTEQGYKLEVMTTKGVTAAPDDEYKNPQEIQELLENFSAKYPELTKLVSIGKSLEGRDIWAIKITTNPQKEDLQKPVVLFNSMHHAREIMTPEVSIDIIEYLLTNFAKKSEVKNWLETTVVWVIPMFNVDGNNKVWEGESLWRKNTRNGYGVDLNRNYPSGWGSCNGSSGNTNSQTYRGEAPASEPETQAMMNFIERTRPVFDISYHAYSQLVIYPYGCKDRKTQTKEVVEKIGKHLGKVLDYKAGTAWELLYNADGGDIDWMYEAYQVIPYVLELNSRWAGGFHPDYSKWRDKTVERNRVGWQYLIKRAHTSGIRGMVYDAKGKAHSNFKIRVMRKVFFNKREVFQTYNGHKSGVFHIVLNPGKYELEVIVDEKVQRTIKTIVKENLERVNILL